MPSIIFQGITMCSLSPQSYQNINVLTSHDALKNLLFSIRELRGFLIKKIYGPQVDPDSHVDWQ